MGSEEIPDIMKIPRPLQEKFFHVAEEEVKRILKRIAEIDALTGRIRDEVARGIMRPRMRDDWREMNIGVVDGSDTPAIDERIGVKYGLYAASYKLFRGETPLVNGEHYLGDRLNEGLHEDRETFLKVLELATVYLERVLANELLEQRSPRIDMLLLDGSFLGYRAGCSRVKEERIDFTEPVTGKHFETVYDLISEINSLTLKIADSGRAVGIIKRVPTTAIDGYVRYKYGDEYAINLRDRAVLSLVMNTGEVFSYQHYLGPGARIDAFSWYKTVAKDKKVRGKNRDKILAEAERRVDVQLIADLVMPAIGGRRGRGEVPQIVGLVKRLRRFFLKTVDGLPPICIEVPDMVSEGLLENVFSYCLKTASPATGLPMSLDLVDELVSLPRRLGRDFVMEVEARLLRVGIDANKLVALFSRFNPQKDEY